MILCVDYSYNDIESFEIFIDENVPPDYIRNIKNVEGSLVPSLMFSVCTVPYYPVIMTGINLGKPGKSNLTIYIGKDKCIDPIYFTNETFQSERKYGTGVGSVFGDYNDRDTYLDHFEDIRYIGNLLNLTNKNPNVQIIKCNLQTINISSIYLKAQDIYIVVDGVLGVANNYFLFKDVSSCSGNTDICNGIGECFLGICLCQDTTLEGPLCNLKRDPDIGVMGNSVIVDPLYPEILYSNSNSSWSIRFTSLDVARKSLQDSRSMIYKQFIHLDRVEWTLTNTTFPDNTNDQSQQYKLVTPNVTITIDVISVGTEREVEFFPYQLSTLKYGVGDLRLSITLSDLSDDLKNTHCFKLVFTIDTINEPVPRCGFLDDEDHFDFDYGRGYDRNDVRWISTTSNFTTLYTRLYGKCLSDQLPQSCIFDLNEDPESQNRGDANIFLFFEPFQTNVTIQPDFKILTFIEFPNITLQPCKEFIPKTDLTKWLIPTIIPVITLGLICLALVIFNLVKVNRNSLLDFDLNNNNSNNGGSYNNYNNSSSNNLNHNGSSNNNNSDIDLDNDNDSDINSSGSSNDSSSNHGNDNLHKNNTNNISTDEINKSISKMLEYFNSSSDNNENYGDGPHYDDN